MYPLITVGIPSGLLSCRGMSTPSMLYIVPGVLFIFAGLRRGGGQFVVGNRDSMLKCFVVFNVENYSIVWECLPLSRTKGGGSPVEGQRRDSRSMGTSVVRSEGFPGVLVLHKIKTMTQR